MSFTGNRVDGLKSISTSGSFLSSGIVGLLNEWIRLNNEGKLPFGLRLGSGVGGVKNSLGSVGGVSSWGSWFSWGSWNFSWESWRWIFEPSTILISDSGVWDGHSLSNFTANIKNDSVIGDITDSLGVSERQFDWLTSVTRSSHVDVL